MRNALQYDAMRCIHPIELLAVVNGRQIVLLILESNAIETMTLYSSIVNPIRWNYCVDRACGLR